MIYLLNGLEIWGYKNYLYILYLENEKQVTPMIVSEKF